ncbi:MAG: bifunctional DNA-binding transcriptional regulator/O6-methylguanine-DNA methyltransferase Ada [Myxococcota bacterium]
MIVAETDTEDLRWRAVLSRDRASDGRFWYAVRTTGVFCRPSCASRAPRRENVTFYEQPADAIEAGFRPCLRCRPTGDDPRDRATRAIVAACRRLEEDASVTTASLAAASGLGANQFLRRFKQHTGVSPQAYRRRARAERAKAELTGAASVVDAALGAGLAPSAFYAQVAPELGMPAAEARAGAERAGATRDVRFTVRACALGRVLVGWTERGVCEVGFGDTDEGLIADLARRLPNARLAEAAAPDWVDAVVDRVDRGRVRDVPIDIQGTAFQERVWAELRRIPPGETRSYAQVAAAIGQPAATRAVARACATNLVAVLIPCHRVVRADGDRSGYRWGAERKAALLDGER